MTAKLDFERQGRLDSQECDALDGDGGGQRSSDDQAITVAAVRTNNLPGATDPPTPTWGSHRESGDGGGQTGTEVHARYAAADPQDFERQSTHDDHSATALDHGDGGDHTMCEAHCRRVAAVSQDFEPGHTGCDTHSAFAGLDHVSRDNQDALVEPGQGFTDTQTTHAGLADARLLIVADTLDDLERARIAAENRLRSMCQVKGLDGSPEYARLAGLVDALAALEHKAELELKRALRLHPLGAWVQQTVGVGEKQGARLLAAIGDPAWNAAEERPRRGPAELWAYCGYVPGQRRRRGERANWNAAAKMRAFLIAESCIKHARSPYRAVYDAARAKHAEATHDGPCVRCGPASKPAPAGSPLSDGHKHARALREVAKAVLKDLWRAARPTSQPMDSPPSATGEAS